MKNTTIGLRCPDENQAGRPMAKQGFAKEGSMYTTVNK